VIVAVFSDVHGNLPALEVFLSHTQGVAEQFICLGDVVNYGPWNDECLERIVSLPNVSLLQGNHERLFLGEDDVTKEAPLVQEFFATSLRHFTRWDLIRDLPPSVTLNDNYQCVHTIEARRIFADTTITVDRNYVVGHTHYQFSIERGEWTIVNPGSIGQNRHRIDRVEWAMYDTQTEQFSFRSEPWDVAQFTESLRRKEYPARCVEYYERKHSEALRG
jgi:predicted phosphodiesterase